MEDTGIPYPHTISIRNYGCDVIWPAGIAFGLS
jgi:hypothetical protein